VLDRYDYGVLGVGEIGAAIVTGLCEGVDDAPRILLSPRNTERAAALASRYPSVSVAPDNQSLASRCSAVVLSVRPKDGRAILGGLAFRPDQAIISVMAGVPDDELASLVAPARDIARAIPLPPVGRRAGVTPVHPGTTAARALFDRLGGASDVGDAGAFEAMSAATGTIAAHLRYLAAIGKWLSDQGVGPEQGARYVRSIFANVAEDLGSSRGNLDELARAHATPGGINERFSAMLEEAGVFDTVGRSLQAIYDTLQVPDSGAVRGETMMDADIRVRRVYEEPSAADGARVLVDRIWPRGLRKDAAQLEEWAKDVAPSTELRTWYGHDPAKFDEFRRRYTAELDEPGAREGIARLCALAADRPVTLLTATKELSLSQAAVLAGLLRDKTQRAGG
jgi:pyrroline-5-carboxylate reductase